MCVCVSTKPGATTRPDASIDARGASAAPRSPTASIDPAADADVGPDGAAGAVDDGAVRDQDVEGRHPAHDTTARRHGSGRWRRPWLGRAITTVGAVLDLPGMVEDVPCGSSHEVAGGPPPAAPRADVRQLAPRLRVQGLDGGRVDLLEGGERVRRCLGSGRAERADVRGFRFHDVPGDPRQVAAAAPRPLRKLHALRRADGAVQSAARPQ